MSPCSLKLACDLVEEAIGFFDAEGRLIYRNRAWAALLGAAAEGASAGACLPSLPEEGRAAFKGALDGARASGARVEHTARVVLPSGEPRELCFTMAMDEEAGLVCVAGRDLEGDRARAREQIMELALNASPVIIWAIDTEGNQFMHMGGGARGMGVEPGQLVGLNAFEIYATETVVLEGMRRSLQGEVVRTHSAAVGRYFSAVCLPTRGPDGAINGVAGLAIDITDLQRVQAELEEKLALIKAQQKTIAELSTPILEVWRGVVALPLLGGLTGQRVEQIMGALLAAIVERRIRFAILDMTGVLSVEAPTADALLKIMQAVRLLGAEGLIVGLSPEVARTVVALGLPLDSIRTLRNLEEGLRHCFLRDRAAPAR
jgi:rsbT co-antagonist protein RsbR